MKCEHEWHSGVCRHCADLMPLDTPEQEAAMMATFPPERPRVEWRERDDLLENLRKSLLRETVEPGGPVAQYIEPLEPHHVAVTTYDGDITMPSIWMTDEIGWGDHINLFAYGYQRLTGSRAFTITFQRASTGHVSLVVTPR